MNITSEEAQKLLDGINRSEPRQLDYFAIADASPALARTVIALAAELAQARADTDEFRMCVNCGLVVPASHDRAQPGPACEAPDACTFDLTPREAWEYWRAKAHQARADAQAAVALVAEKAVEAVHETFPGTLYLSNANKAVDAIRALAPVDGLAEVAKLRAERDALKAQKWDVRHTDTMNDMVSLGIERDRLAAENAALQEQVKGLVGAVTAYHLALDRRENGNTAGYRLQDDIQRILNMPWRQGAALAAVQAKEGGE